MKPLHSYSILTLHEKLLRREVSAQEILHAFISRIRTTEDRVHSFLRTDEPGAEEQAERIDRDIAAGTIAWTPLTGIPLALKDNICTLGMQTTCGSRILEGYLPPYDASVVSRLRQSGAVILGKTNCDEFAMGSSTENSAFQKTMNPWNLQCVPGGSSGGSAAAVACGQVAGSFGSDTGGSIRQPAAFCGILGLKPTYGRVSRYGLVAYASSLDQIGPFGRETGDLAVLLQTVAGWDTKDATSAEVPVPDYLAERERPVKGLRIGVPREVFGPGLDKEVENSVRSALDQFLRLGCEVVEISLPHTEYAIAAYYILAPAEASSNLARYDGVRYGFRADHAGDLADMYGSTRSQGFGREVKRRIMIGTYVLSSGYYEAYYLKAQKVRTLIRCDYDRAFERVDVVLTPTSPTTAFRLGEHMQDPLSMYLSDIYTVTANLAGIPGISVPCGLSSHGMPIGMQLLAPCFEEGRLLQAAYAYETSHPFEAPPLPL